MAKRDYKKEYKKFQSSPIEIAKRAARNKARAEENAKRKKNGKPKLRKDQHVSHVTKNGKTTTRVKSAKKNLGSNKDTPGDKNTRGKGCKKKQPKKGRK
jgi:hypothetical protein|tara:strand:+ start:293 stop:589 length:297 start_codon:yes stop_codon:yes gene_type:complete